MSTLSKVLLGLVIVATLVFAFTAMRTLKTHQNWRERAASLEQQIEQFETQNEQIVRGTEGQPGIAELRVELHDVLVDRGRAWREGAPGEIDESGATSVTLDERDPANPQQPIPHGINGNALLYVFEQTTEERAGRGQYLGTFRVTGVTEADAQAGTAGQVAIAPERPLSARALERLQASTGPWILYDVMPRDRYGLFAELAEDELRAMLPGVSDEALAQYTQHGEPAPADAPDERRDADGNYVRPLRDYDVLFREYDRQMTLLRDKIASAESAIAAMQFANTDAEQQEQFRNQEIESLRQELGEVRRELAAVTEHHARLTAALAASQAEIAETMAENKRLAAEFAALQLKAAAVLAGEPQASAP